MDEHQLVQWYRDNRRDLPWRRTSDAYAIWLSETMLQQTRVETVIPYYHNFLARFPTVRDLAAADFEEVAKLWQGLGYYRRARNLHAAAQKVVELYDGVIPDDEQAFRALPGIGPYTAGAVMSIAFNKPVPAVDGNVLRVMTRYLAVDRPVETPEVHRTVTQQVAKWLQDTPPADLTQALMELGATVCVPRNPSCDTCPLERGCVAKAEGRAEALPVRKPKQPKKKRRVYAFWLERDGAVLVERRPDDGLLGGMWQLPALEFDVNLAPELPADTFASLTEAKHVFTHIEWQVTVFRPVGLDAHRTDLPVILRESGIQTEAYASEEAGASMERRWVAFDEIDKLVLPRVYERLFADILIKE